MNTNFSNFLDPISPTQPAGINIEYDARFINIQSLAEGKPEQQYGDIIIEAEEPDWNSIEKLCRQLLSESKDVRAFCLYIQALTVNYGIIGFKTGCEILFKNLELYWDDIYPLLTDEDDEFDPFYRINSIGLLLFENGILRQVYNCKILEYGNARSHLLVKDVVSIINNDSEQYPGGRERLIEDLKVAYEANHEELVAIEDALRIIENIESLYNVHLQDNLLDFSLIKKPLITIYQIIVDKASSDDKVEDSVKYEKKVVEEDKVYKQRLYDLRDIKISNRDDVNIVLEKLTLYFRLKEPSHPAPLFIDRLKKLMDMNFYEIMKEISPNSINDLENIIGTVDDELEER